MTERLQKLQPNIIQFYVVNKKTTKEIAELLHINKKTVIKILKINDVELRRPIKNLIGDVYGRLKVIRFIRLDNSRKAVWECLCNDGNRIEARSGDLISGKIKSCGCYRVETCRENVKNAHKKYPKSYGFKGIGELKGGYFNSIKSRCIKNKRECSISKEYIWDLYLKQNKKCALTGLDICFGKIENGIKKEQTASLDRMDSSKGYVEGNVHWVHKDINNMKQDFSMEKLLNYCKLIYEKHIIQNKNLSGGGNAI